MKKAYTLAPCPFCRSTMISTGNNMYGSYVCRHICGSEASSMNEKPYPFVENAKRARLHKVIDTRNNKPTPKITVSANAKSLAKDECEALIAKKLREIFDIACRYNPKSDALEMHIAKSNNLISVHNRYYTIVEHADAEYPINYSGRLEVNIK